MDEDSWPMEFAATPPPPDIEDLLTELEELAESSGTAAERERIEEMIDLARRVQYPGVFGRVIKGFDRADAAEALVGSVIFGIPMIIESGTLEAGAHIAQHPIYFLLTFLGAIWIVIGVLYVAEIQRVQIYRPLFGVLPRRLVGVISISFLTAVVLMTAWGRVDWATPWLALSQVTVAFAGMSLGAALGDILPGS